MSLPLGSTGTKRDRTRGGAGSVRNEGLESEAFTRRVEEEIKRWIEAPE
jgi:hypothetical protein